jgi:CHAT domain-containing protein
MTNPEPSNKFNINIGQVTGGDIQVGDRTYLSQPNPAPSESAPSPAPKRTILLLASSPADQTRLRLDTEVREIDQGLRLSQQRSQFDLQQRWAVRPDDLRRALLDMQPQIVHFCGHGEGAAGLVLEDESGNAKLVSTPALTSLFQLFSNRGLECVVLNACYSEVQAEAIAQHIPFVIGMNDAIGDIAAVKFSVGFYDALGAGWSYPEAYELGCNAIALTGSSQDSIPVLKSNAIAILNDL